MYSGDVKHRSAVNLKTETFLGDTSEHAADLTRFVRPLARLAIKARFGNQLFVGGLGRTVAMDAPAVFVSNHSHFLDPLVVAEQIKNSNQNMLPCHLIHSYKDTNKTQEVVVKGYGGHITYPGQDFSDESQILNQSLRAGNSVALHLPMPDGRVDDYRHRLQTQSAINFTANAVKLAKENNAGIFTVGLAGFSKADTGRGYVIDIGAKISSDELSLEDVNSDAAMVLNQLAESVQRAQEERQAFKANR